MRAACRCVLLPARSARSLPAQPRTRRSTTTRRRSPAASARLDQGAPTSGPRRRRARGTGAATRDTDVEAGSAVHRASPARVRARRRRAVFLGLGRRRRREPGRAPATRTAERPGGLECRRSHDALLSACGGVAALARGSGGYGVDLGARRRRSSRSRLRRSFARAPHVRTVRARRGCARRARRVERRLDRVGRAAEPGVALLRPVADRRRRARPRLAARGRRRRRLVIPAVLAGIVVNAGEILIRSLARNVPAEWFYGRRFQGAIGYHSAQANLSAIGLALAVASLVGRSVCWARARCRAAAG